MTATSADLARVLSRRFVVVAGKGGVGKSTVSAALAREAARRGKRVLVVELGGRERVGALLGRQQPVGYAPTRVLPNIDVINVQPPQALREYGLMKLRFERVYDLVFENPLMRSLTRWIPGMNELVLIGKAWHLEQERQGGRPRWDTLIVDSPATGHGISLLQLPHVITENVKRGPLADEVGVIRDMLTDPARSCMTLVTLCEEMPVRETLDLARAMQTTLRIAPGLLVLNGLYPALPDAEIEGRVRALRGGGLDGAARAAQFLTERRRIQEAHRRFLGDAQLPLPQVELPYVFSPEFDSGAVAFLASRFEQLPAPPGASGSA